MRCFSVSPSRNSMAMKDWPSCFANVVNRADVGMVQRRRGRSLTPETFQSLRILGHVFGQELQGDKAAELGCPRPCRPHPSRRRPSFSTMR